jgi:hypothetical protein
MKTPNEGEKTVVKVPGNEMGEKASIGGKYNSGVTSGDPKEKEEIEKQANMKEEQPASDKEKSGKDQENFLTKEDLPDSTNESTGVPGTGQRQDSN